MSFLRKLFGSEHNGTPQTAPLTDERRVAPQTVPLSAAPASPTEDTPPDAAPTPPAGSERPWWEESASPPVPASAPGTAPLTRTNAPPTENTTVNQQTPDQPTATVPSPSTPDRLPGDLAAAALRDIGQVRSINQDSVFALITTVRRESSDLSVGLFIVADGMGGHDGGEVASRIAVNTVASEVLRNLLVPALAEEFNTDMQSVIVEAVQAANHAIWEHGRAVGSDMGTTCTAALLLGHALYVGHVGDSRLYVRTPAGLECITDDHSAVGRLIQLGQLDASEAREHPLRSQLYRTVGQMPEVAVDYVYYRLGDATHLLLCSDGLWGMIGDNQIRDALTEQGPRAVAQSLIAQANEAGGDDNISAVVVTLPGA